MANINIRSPSLVMSSQSYVENENTAQPTVVIFGVPRGGTTMVAGIAQRCGINIGSNLPVNLEDPEFVDRSAPDMKATIARNNSLGTAWGWKFPRVASYILDIQDELQNPHYICVWRDILANSQRRIRNGDSCIDSLNWAHDIQKRNIDLLNKLNGPCMLVSYEKSLLDPDKLANDIIDFVGLDSTVDQSELQEFTKPGSYKTY